MPQSSLRSSLTLTPASHPFCIPPFACRENWQSTNFAPEGSYNHIMYGGFGKWLYSGVAGLYVP